MPGRPLVAGPHPMIPAHLLRHHALKLRAQEEIDRARADYETRAAAKPRWTDAPPTEPGFYWRRFLDDHLIEGWENPYVCQVRLHRGALSATWPDGVGRPTDYPPSLWWPVPIEPPGAGEEGANP